MFFAVFYVVIQLFKHRKKPSRGAVCCLMIYNIFFVNYFATCKATRCRADVFSSFNILKPENNNLTIIYISTCI